MTFNADFLSHLTHPQPQTWQTVRGSGHPQPVTNFEAQNEISPADPYCYLFARFGPPNGVQNLLRRQGSDSLIHWHWTLEHAGSLFDIQGASFRTIFTLAGPSSSESYLLEDLVHALKADFVVHGKAMSECRKSLEHWIEFVNPFQRLCRSINHLMEELAQLGPDEISEPAVPVDEPDQAVQAVLAKQWETAASKLSRAFGICFGIRSMLPVMAESFVNLLLFTLMRTDLRADRRLRENVFRQNIDIRIKTLHRDCRGFSKPVDYSHSACKRFHTLMNERNDLLHGNVVVKDLRFNDLYFARDVPIFKNYRSMWERAFEVHRRAVGLHRLKDDVDVVMEFIDYVLSCLTPKVRANFAQILSAHDLGYNEKDDRVGLFVQRALHRFSLRSVAAFLGGLLFPPPRAQHVSPYLATLSLRVSLGCPAARRGTVALSVSNVHTSLWDTYLNVYNALPAATGSRQPDPWFRFKSHCRERAESSRNIRPARAASASDPTSTLP